MNRARHVVAIREFRLDVLHQPSLLIPAGRVLPREMCAMHLDSVRPALAQDVVLRAKLDLQGWANGHVYRLTKGALVVENHPLVHNRLAAFEVVT